MRYISILLREYTIILSSEVKLCEFKIHFSPFSLHIKFDIRMRVCHKHINSLINSGIELIIKKERSSIDSINRVLRLILQLGKSNKVNFN